MVIAGLLLALFPLAFSYSQTYEYVESRDYYTEEVLLATFFWVEGKIGKCTAQIYKPEYEPTYKKSKSYTLNPGIDSNKQSRSSWYSQTGWDRGHLAPAADLTWSQVGTSQVNYVTNIAPQDPYTNQQPWREMETALRAFATTNNTELFIVTCTAGNHTQVNGLVVPQYYYKLACQYNNASDTLLLQASNTKVETDQEKSERKGEVYELRDAKKGLEALGDEFNPFAQYSAHNTFGYLTTNCYQYPALKKSAWNGLRGQFYEEQTDDGDGEGEGNPGDDSSFNVTAFVICVVIILIIVGVIIFLCRRREHIKRMAEIHSSEEGEPYIPSEAQY